MRDRSLIFDQLWAASADGPRWVFDRGSEAVRLDDGQVSLREIAKAAGRAAALFESQGTRPGDRCVVWLDTPLDIIIAAAALTAIGAVPVQLSPALDIDTVRQVLAPLPPVDRVVTTSSRLRSSSALEVKTRTDDWASLADEAASLEPRRSSLALPPTAPYVVTHTSGTTGVSKLVMYSRGSTDHNSLTQEMPALIQRLRGRAAISFSPVHFRFVVGLLAALRRKVPAIVLADEDPASVGPLLRRWQPSYLEAHPNTFMKWEPLAPAGALSSVKCFLTTFDVVHPGTVRNLLEGSRYPFALFWEIYGQSELCAIAGILHVRGFTAAPGGGVSSGASADTCSAGDYQGTHVSGSSTATGRPSNPAPPAESRFAPRAASPRISIAPRRWALTSRQTAGGTPATGARWTGSLGSA